VVTWSFVLRIKCSAGRQFSASKTPTSCSCKTLPAMLNDHTITTLCKVKGGLSSNPLLTDFDVNQMRCTSFNFLSVDSQPLTFIEDIADRQSSNMTKNAKKQTQWDYLIS
jgi:hypothetical protein